mgnify:CR=1 FL=1
MDNANKKRAEQLGMPFGTAANRLRKEVLFSLLKRHNENICARCKKEIENVEQLSLEHLVPWLDSDDPIRMFFNIDNIAFSHMYCNVSAARRVIGPRTSHGTMSRYNNNCRCDKCKQSYTEYRRQRRENGFRS